jgi:hypothetical protein
MNNNTINIDGVFVRERLLSLISYTAVGKHGGSTINKSVCSGFLTKEPFMRGLQRSKTRGN